ncbi:TPA: lipoprotein [Staphylococcus aureus]|nr:lipoprotein [Staphylococcus aureus]HDB3143318.1 lipoprotein [Staphylococcus aureus]HDE8374451.1 lipoprotein [Staphylococcus aureus]HEA0113301.1 lipoprotein [Staphylococcus aureus]
MKKIGLLLVIVLAVVLSACNDNTTEKKENKLLESTKNKEADSVAQETLMAIASSDRKSMSKLFSDQAIKNYCEKTKTTTLAGEKEQCTRESLRENNNTFEPEGNFYTILAQYSNGKTYYIAKHDNDVDQKASTNGVKSPENEDMRLEKFTVTSDSTEKYKVSNVYKWSDNADEEKIILDKFKNKENVYELKGNYSDLFEE